MFWHLISRLLSHFVTFTFFVTILTWISLAVGAAITFMVRRDHGLAKTFSGFMRFCFPRVLFQTRSPRVDSIYWVLNRLSLPLFITPLIVGSIFISALTYQALTNMFGPHLQAPRSMLVWVCIATVVMIGTDFATFYTHYLDHKIPVLWQFHKVHHSPEFLIPMTAKRFHPVQQIFDDTGVGLTTGLLLGVFSYLFSMPIYENTIVGIDAYFVVNALSFYHLRHSHISMSYGWLEKWLLSPAQHQLHHSQEGRHWDKNFGLFLSIWDRLFGTFKYSEAPGSFRLGLPGAEGDKYQSIPQLYVTPFFNIWEMAKRRLHSAASSPQSVNVDDVDLKIKVS